MTGRTIFVMYPYHFLGVKVMYYSPNLGDIEEHNQEKFY